jgi:hypothetical protein
MYLGFFTYLVTLSFGLLTAPIIYPDHPSTTSWELRDMPMGALDLDRANRAFVHGSMLQTKSLWRVTAESPRELHQLS